MLKRFRSNFLVFQTHLKLHLAFKMSFDSYSQRYNLETNSYSENFTSINEIIWKLFAENFEKNIRRPW
jgi:hypothetical protein